MNASLTFLDQMKLIRLLGARGATTIIRKLRLHPLLFWRLSGPASNELLIAPYDLNTADPTLATDFYAGYFSFAGKTVNCSGTSPFHVQAPNLLWSQKLIEFGWLRHLRASETHIAKAQARIYVDDWIKLNQRSKGISWNIESTAKRVIAWLSHSPLLLDGCDHAFFHKFMKSLTRQVRYLKFTIGEAPAGLPRLYAAVALTYAAVCLSGYETFLKTANKRLTQELEKQFLPDGGHISRNPGAMIEALSLLLPLKQAILARDFVPDPLIINTIDRIMPMLRFFRLGDGNFAHFNGMGDTPSDLLATILAYDDTAGSVSLSAPHSGYQRLQADKTIMIVDTGTIKNQTYTRKMHAGCLSFELSSGAERLIVNAGQPSEGSIDRYDSVWVKLARSTATHSTLSINHESSCRFVESKSSHQMAGMLVLSGPQKVRVERENNADGSIITAEHDGYVPNFKLKHKRVFSLSGDGKTLNGTDLLLTPKDQPPRSKNTAQFQIRFHLHPNVAAHLSSSRTVELRLKSGEKWLFSCADCDIAMDESVVLADVFRSYRSSQITIEGNAGKISEVNWVLQRLS